jgi:AcrR family transcriptional regulator
LPDAPIDVAPVADRRQRILEAAVRVFAVRGYHAARVGDIAEEAGVAHGLLYHYFSSKEEVLRTLFRDSWRLVITAMHGIETTDDAAPEKLRRIAAVLLRSWRHDPDLVRVLVREVARSPQVERQADELAAALASIARIVERGQAAGELRGGVEPRLASWIFYGALEELLLGWVLGRLPDGDEDVARAERAVVDVLCGGLAPAPERAAV